MILAGAALVGMALMQVSGTGAKAKKLMDVLPQGKALKAASVTKAVKAS
jgi:hypothetical protein